MNIIFDTDVTAELKKSHTLLELDTFNISDGHKTAYCVVDAGQLNTEDMFHLDKLTDLHAALISHYKDKDYAFCLTAISALKGRFGGQADSFYEILESRITTGAPNEIFT